MSEKDFLFFNVSETYNPSPMDKYGRVKSKKSRRSRVLTMTGNKSISRCFPFFSSSDQEAPLTNSSLRPSLPARRRIMSMEYPKGSPFLTKSSGGQSISLPTLILGCLASQVISFSVRCICGFESPDCRVAVADECDGISTEPIMTMHKKRRVTRIEVFFISVHIP